MMQSSVVGVGPPQSEPSKWQPKSQTSVPGVHDTACSAVLVSSSGSGAATSSATQPADTSANVHATNSSPMNVILMRETVHAVLAPTPARALPEIPAELLLHRESDALSHSLAGISPAVPLVDDVYT